VTCCTSDEGRPHGVADQPVISNRPELHSSRAIVVSVRGKGMGTHARYEMLRRTQVNHRRSVDNCNWRQNRDLDVIPGLVGRKAEFRPVGVRHIDGVTISQALVRNLGNCRSDVKGDIQSENLRGSEYRSGAQWRSHA
jgi:hypothetical protein